MNLKPQFLLKSLILLMVLAIDSYILINGLEALPDYDGYFIMAEKNRDGLSDGRALLELIPKLFLGGVFTSGKTSDDIVILTALSQLFTVYFYILYKPGYAKGLNLGTFLLAGLTGPFFLTTAIRAAPAYLLSAIVFGNGVKPSWKNVFLLCAAIFWHDTGIVCLIVASAAFAVGDKTEKLVGFIRKSYSRLLLFFIFIGLIFKTMVAYAPVDLLVDLLGYRAVYITSNNETVLKEVFIVLVILLGMFCIRKCSLNTRQTFWVITFCLITILVALINQVAGVRMSFYIIAATLPMFRFENFTKIPDSIKLYTAVFLFLSLTTFSLWDLNRNYYRNLDAAVNQGR
jgi:hypothetical protein